MRNLNTQNKVLFPEQSFKIMEAVFEVHNQLGPGFNEDIYENALIHELTDREIRYEQQKVVSVNYKGKPIGSYRLDLVIENKVAHLVKVCKFQTGKGLIPLSAHFLHKSNKVILELKAVNMRSDLFKAQLLAYLKASDLQLGILINFGTKRVEDQRIVN